MFLPRPIFIANLNDEAYYKRLYHLGDVERMFTFQSSYKFDKNQNIVVVKQSSQHK